MNVEELKRHIHKELFGDSFLTSSPVFEWKEQQKEAVMRRSVKIMQRHEQSEEDILLMLQEKFLLTEAQAKEFMNKEFSSKEDDSKDNDKGVI